MCVSWGLSSLCVTERRCEAATCPYSHNVLPKPMTLSNHRSIPPQPQGKKIFPLFKLIIFRELTQQHRVPSIKREWKAAPFTEIRKREKQVRVLKNQGFTVASLYLLQHNSTLVCLGPSSHAFQWRKRVCLA